MTSPLATRAYLQSTLTGQNQYAVVSGSGASQFISAEVGPDSGTISIPPLVGPTGPAGDPLFNLRLQLTVLSDPSQLPTDLTNTDADIGKYWIIVQTDGSGNVISSAAYIWYGAEFRFLDFGTQGPPGIYPHIAPKVALTGNSSAVSTVSAVTGTGAATSPYGWTLNLHVPAGPEGEAAPLASFSDVNMTVPPTLGQFLAYNGTDWAPADVGDIFIQPYTVPESAFISIAGIRFASTTTVCAFSVPPQPFAWKPLVWGQLAMFELELSLNPLAIGVEVRLGSPTGTLVARGFGNSLSGVVTLVPHASDPGNPSVEITPSNATAEVPANHGGTQGTLYVNLLNDGIAALYDFNASNSELVVLAVPTSSPAPVTTYGTLGTKVTLSARSVTHGS